MRPSTFSRTIAALLPLAGARASALDWSPVTAAVDAFSGYPTTPFAVLVGNASGLLFNYSRGYVNLTAQMPVGTATSWVSAIAIAKVVEAATGGLNWGSHPQSFTTSWPRNPADDRANITLRQALSQTTGLGPQPCTSPQQPRGESFWGCVANISATNPLPLRYGSPGSQFSMGGQHLHVAGAMAAAAVAGTTNDTGTWQPVFAGLRTGANLPPQCCNYAPGPNPGVGTGLAISPLHYADILRAYTRGPGGSGPGVQPPLLSPPTLSALQADATPNGTVSLAGSPLTDAGLAWHYSGGHWMECRANATCATGDAGCSGAPQATWLPACDAGCERSAPSGTGFYPYVNSCFKRGTPSGFWAIVVTPNGTALESITLGTTLWPAVRAAFTSQFLTPTTTASPTASATPSVSASATGSTSPPASSTPTPSGSGVAAAASGTGSASATATVSGTPPSTASPTGTLAASATPSASSTQSAPLPSASATVTAAASTSASASTTAASTQSAASTGTPTQSSPPTPSSTPASTPASTPSPTPVTPSATMPPASGTSTASPSLPATATPTATNATALGERAPAGGGASDAPTSVVGAAIGSVLLLGVAAGVAVFAALRIRRRRRNHDLLAASTRSDTSMKVVPGPASWRIHSAAAPHAPPTAAYAGPRASVGSSGANALASFNSANKLHVRVADVATGARPASARSVGGGEAAPSPHGAPPVMLAATQHAQSWRGGHHRPQPHH